MKKLLCCFLCLTMLMSLLAACGNNVPSATTQPSQSAEHKHTYAEAWSGDETHHWYDATCEHSALKANYGEHLDENLDAACDICGFVTTDCVHTYSEEWSSDAQSHWHAATCIHIGTVSDQGAHADEDNDGACDVCGYDGGHSHTFQEAWSSDATKHWHASTCDHAVVADEQEHVDENMDGNCDVCSWYDRDHTHTYSDAYTSDVTYHWFGATCEHVGAFTGMEQHVDDDQNGYCDTCNYLMCQHVDYDLDGDCDICAGPLDPEHVHSFDSQTGCDTTGHWYIATCHPGANSVKEPHVDSNNNGVCDVCDFQMCGHSYAATWTTNETHHWHAILCTCSIERKNYEKHVDNDGDGGCDVCMYGIPIPAVYEVILEYEPFLFEHTSMLCYMPFTVYFPQPGRYVITPDNEYISVRESKDSFGNSYYLTLDVQQAGEMTLYFESFDFDYYEGKETIFTYTVIRMDDLVLETMQGKVELPSNTIYTIKFHAPKVGKYKLISGAEGLVIGLTEDTMEYFKGHIEMDVEYVGQEFTLYVFYESSTEFSFTFDWCLEEPFALGIGEGSYSVDVGPTQVDYRVDFTAPTDGYYLLQLHNKWLTFAQMGDVYDVPVRLETMEVLTHHMTAGEVYTIWVQTVYDYPEATRCFDTLTVTNVGQKMAATGGTVTPGAAGSRYNFQANKTIYYRMEIIGGELGIITAAGTVTWISDAYEVKLTAGQTYSFMLRGAGSVTVNISTVEYRLELMNGDNTVYMEPSRYYDISFLYSMLDQNGNPTLGAMNENSIISLNWEGNLSVYVNGEEYTRGAEIPLMNTTVQIVLKNNGGADVKIKVTIVYDGNDSTITGESEQELAVNQLALMAVNRDEKGATATFTAEIGGSYTLTTYDAVAMVYLLEPNGSTTLVMTGANTYSFHLDAGETITFYFDTTDASAASLSVLVSPEN